jgi:hypothetical protein
MLSGWNAFEISDIQDIQLSLSLAKTPQQLNVLHVTCYTPSLYVIHFKRALNSREAQERWVESCRRDLLDHVIAVNERHLKRLLSEYVRYYHEDRTHLGLRKGTPEYRIRSTASGHVLSQDRLGGLHHRYDRAA